MDEDMHFRQVFMPFPKYQPIERTPYKNRCIFSDKNAVKKLILDVVESPNLQLVSDQVKRRPLLKNSLTSSSNFTPRSIIQYNRKSRITLDYFRSEPFSPFIPDLIIWGVNLVENDCHKTGDWSLYYHSKKDLTRDVITGTLDFYLKSPRLSKSLKSILLKTSVDEVALSILQFFTIFEKKPLHFDSFNLSRLTSKPLYDKFLRPNPNLLNIVKGCVLKGSRTEVDTLAFMMLHILHIWEYSNLPLKTKVKLSKLFGPLLISFENPIFIYKTEYSASPQSAVLEAILEICDSDFWITLNFSQRGEIFTTETPFEMKKSSSLNESRDKPPEFLHLCDPYALFPNISKSISTNVLNIIRGQKLVYLTKNSSTF